MAKNTILIVEDSPTNLRLIEEILKKEEYRIVTAVDGEEALEKALEEKPDLLVLDIILPKKKRFPGLPTAQDIT